MGVLLARTQAARAGSPCPGASIQPLQTTNQRRAMQHRVGLSLNLANSQYVYFENYLFQIFPNVYPEFQGLQILFEYL